MVQLIWSAFLDLSFEKKAVILGMTGTCIVAIAKAFAWWYARHKHQISETGEKTFISMDQHVTSILSQVRAAEEQLNTSHAKEQKELQAKLIELETRLKNPEKSLENARKTIASLEATLDRESENIDANKLAEAKAALERGEYAAADALFADIEKREANAIKAAAHAAFARGEIAEQEVRWRDAAKHYQDAVKRVPSFLNTFKAARLATNSEDYEVALKYGDAAIQLSQKQFCRDSWQHAGALIEQGALLTHLAKYDDAELILKDGVKIAQNVQGNLGFAYCLGILALSRLFQLTNRPADAENLLRKVISIFQETDQEINADHATALNNLSMILTQIKQVEEAEELMRRSGNIISKLQGKEHPQYARYLNNLGMFLLNQSRLDEAETLFLAAGKVTLNSLGKNSFTYARDLNSLAEVYCGTNRLDEAKSLFEKAISISKKSLGDTHPSTLSMIKNYSRHFLKPRIVVSMRQA